jgi:hypothetical protein
MYGPARKPGPYLFNLLLGTPESIGAGRCISWRQNQTQLLVRIGQIAGPSSFYRKNILFGNGQFIVGGKSGVKRGGICTHGQYDFQAAIFGHYHRNGINRGGRRTAGYIGIFSNVGTRISALVGVGWGVIFVAAAQKKRGASEEEDEFLHIKSVKSEGCGIQRTIKMLKF